MTRDNCKPTGSGKRPQPHTQAHLSRNEQAAALLDSPVTQRVPIRIRQRLEHALIDRKSHGRSYAQIRSDLDLAQFGVSVEMIEDYALRIDALVRPVASSQVIAGMLGCLPASARAELLNGNQLLLLSKLAQVLIEAQAGTIESSELVKLAGVLRSASQVRRAEADDSVGSEGGRPSKAEDALFDHDRIAQAVHTLYGLAWPPADGARPAAAGSQEKSRQ